MGLKLFGKEKEGLEHKFEHSIYKIIFKNYIVKRN